MNKTKDYSGCVIMTVSPDLLKPAVRELQLVANNANVIDEFGNGIYLVRVHENPIAFLKAFAESNPIFVKHIMPVCEHMEIADDRVSAIAKIVRVSQSLAKLRVGEQFAVQSRLIDRCDAYTAKDVEVAVGSHLEQLGSIPTFSDTEVGADDDLKIISIVIRQSDCFVGFSTAMQNLNEHCDEFRVFSRRPRTICRAEYKLLEAIRKFRIVPRGQHAIDLGAAPGGWTNILAQKGFRVAAIDPGMLHDKVLGLSTVTHMRIRAELFNPDREYDLLVNDMNMEPTDSCAIMLNVSSHLRVGALGIMTIKFDTNRPEPFILKAKDILASRFKVLQIKSLFHNRQEVTALLRRQ